MAENKGKQAVVSTASLLSSKKFLDLKKFMSLKSYNIKRTNQNKFRPKKKGVRKLIPTPFNAVLFI